MLPLIRFQLTAVPGNSDPMARRPSPKASEKRKAAKPEVVTKAQMDAALEKQRQAQAEAKRLLDQEGARRALQLHFTRRIQSNSNRIPTKFQSNFCFM